MAIVLMSLTAAGMLSGCSKGADNGAATGRKRDFSRVMDFPKVTDPVQGAAESASITLQGRARTATGGGAAGGLNLFRLKDAYTGPGYTAGSRPPGLCHSGKGLARTLQDLNNQTGSLVVLGMLLDAKKLASGNNSDFGYSQFTGSVPHSEEGGTIPFNMKTRIQIVRNGSNSITSIKMYSCQKPDGSADFSQNYYLSAVPTYNAAGANPTHLTLTSVNKYSGSSFQYSGRSVASGEIGMGGWTGVKTISTESSGGGTYTGSSYTYFDKGIMNQTASNFTFQQRQSNAGTYTFNGETHDHANTLTAGLKADLITNSSSKFGFNVGSGCLKSTTTGFPVVNEEVCFDSSQAVVSNPTYQPNAQAAHTAAQSITANNAVVFQNDEIWDCSLPSGSSWTTTTLATAGADQQLWNNIMEATAPYQGGPDMSFTCPSSDPTSGS